MKPGCTWILLLWLIGCGDRNGSPTVPSPTTAAFVETMRIHIRAHPAGPELIGLWNPRDGRSWRGSGPWSIRPGPAPSTILELAALPRSEAWTPLRVPWFAGNLPTELLLLPRVEFTDSEYPQALDLLTECVAPFSAGVVRRWHSATLRVARPLPVDGVDYLGTLEEAVQIWNQALSREVLHLVAWSEEAEVICELSEESRLGYVRRLEEDPERHPLRMLIHLSPRWGLGTERYVRRAWLHELGHVLGLWGHSRDPRHLMHGRFIAVDAPHPEELLVLDWVWQLPHGTHLGWYRRSDSVEESMDPRAPRTKNLSPTPPPGPRANGTVDCHPTPN